MQKKNLQKYKNSQVQALLRGWSVGCGFALMDDPSLMDPPSSCTFISLSFAQIFSSFRQKYQLSFTYRSRFLNVMLTFAHHDFVMSKCFDKSVLCHL